MFKPYLGGHYHKTQEVVEKHFGWKAPQNIIVEEGVGGQYFFKIGRIIVTNYKLHPNQRRMDG